MILFIFVNVWIFLGTFLQFWNFGFKRKFEAMTVKLLVQPPGKFWSVIWNLDTKTCVIPAQKNTVHELLD